MSFELLAAEVIRAIRGRRSQRLSSKRLGYRSNVFYHWEKGRALPTASTFFRCVRQFGASPADCLRSFFGTSAPAFSDEELVTDAGMVLLVRHLCQNVRISVLAERTGRTRFVISRWLNGQTVLRLPALLAMVEAASLRSVDFVAAFADPAQLPSIATLWRTHEESRRAAYDHPWTQAVLRGLDLADYRSLHRHRRGWLAQRLGIKLEEEEQCLGILERAGQIRMTRGCWRVQTVQTVDTRRSPGDARRLRGFWLEVAQARHAANAPGVYAYNVCSLSAADHEKLKELHRQFFRDMQELVERSEPSERVVLLATQLINLDAAE